ncbi:MAG: Zn-ribbon domain-containing OB-fold protein [Anaerolineales bacterium]|nr:Zn-ribbon domain-containing OB-fold protein [Anaerolineae bacterium]MBL6982752.1 Zn-ribbon domain-containing OB-fold protein [Anaerolineales bacterium]
MTATKSTTTKRAFTAASFDQYLNEKKLMGSHCANCDANFLPPRAICPDCYDDQLEWVELDGKAKLAAFTSIYIAPTAMINEGYGRDKPYVAGVVELDDGVKISAQILGLDAANPEEIKIGTPLQAEFIERGEGDEKRTFLAFRAK